LSGFEIVGADAELYAEIVRRFEAYNRVHTNWGAETYAAVLRRGGRAVAAARGITNMGLVEIRGVWVDPELRGKGLGRGLMAAVEEEARRRGCTRAALDTYSWQAVGFYLRLGYREYGVLDYPNGARRHFMVRDLG
jgi:GNAT superfamily N-acetyltransferase